jgi:hypothetical protein
MGRGNRKKNKGGNVAYADMVSKPITTNSDKSEFTEVVKTKTKPKFITETNSPAHMNLKPKQFELNKNKNTNTNKIFLDEKTIYVNRFVDYYWQFIGKYHHTDNIIVSPESDNEYEYYYDEY